MENTNPQTHKLHPKVKFTIEDDKKLREIVSRCGENDWNLIATKMETRNARQCKERWENYLCSSVNRSQFTAEEDMLLLTKYNELGSKWVSISKFFQNRTDISIKSRWMVLKRRHITIDTIGESLLTKSKPKDEYKTKADKVDNFISQLTEIAQKEEDESGTAEEK